MARATPPSPPTARPALPGVQAASRLLAQGRLDEAEQSLAELRERFPKSAPVLTLHGDALFRLERHDEALTAYEKAWDTGARHAVLLLNLAACLTRGNRAEEALQKLEGLLEREPRHAGALRAQGDAWRHLRQPAKALEAYQRALALQPKDALLYQAIAHLDHFEADSPAFDALRERSRDPALGLREKARVLATLGKAWMDVGDDDQAFSCYAQANAIMDAELPPIRSELERLLSFTRRHFTRPLFDALAPHGVQTRPQIIIAGMSRSGKSLVESLFRGVAGVQLAGEELVLSQHRETVQAAVGDRMDAWLAALTPDQVAQDAQAYLERLDAGEKIKITTVPGDLWNLGLVGLWTPQVPIIFCVRDVLDLGVTGYFQQYQFPEGYRYSYDQHQLGRQIAIYEKVMEHWAQVLPNPIYLVDYEALVQNPQEVMDNLLDALELRRDQDYADIIAENAHLADRLGPVESMDAPMPVTSRFVGIGRRFQKHLEPMMKGYRRIVESFPRCEPPSALPHALPDVMYDGDAAALPSEITPFDWQMTGRITALDNGSHLLRSGALERLSGLGAFSVVSFDPAGDAPAFDGDADAAHLQTLPRTVLGGGGQLDLRVCLDARYNSTLEPLPAEQLDERRAQDCIVLTRLPVNSVALDQIQGLEALEWLLLDAYHDSMTILEHGKHILKTTLLIHAGVLFQPTYERQPNLAELSHWAAHNGFRFYRLIDTDHEQHMPVRNDLVRQPPGSQLRHAAALFIPDPARLAQLDDAQRLRLAFLLDTVYDIHDLSADLLQQIGTQLGEHYLKARGYFDRQRGGANRTQIQKLLQSLELGRAHSAAMHEVNRLARAWPRDAQVGRLVAEHASWMSSNSRAVSLINSAIERDPADASIRRSAIGILARAGIWWEAENARRILQAHCPGDGALAALETELLATHPAPDPERLAEALETLQTLPAEPGPQQARLYLLEAQSELLNDNVEAACEAFWQACDTRPHSPCSHFANQLLVRSLTQSASEHHQNLARLQADLQELRNDRRKAEGKRQSSRDAIPYQGLESLMLHGARPSLQRLQAYGLEAHMDEAPARTLDIGCNQGFLLLGMADRLSQGVGIDIDAAAIEIGQAVAEHMGHAQIELKVQSFEKFKDTLGFDLILACAVHHHMSLPAEELGERLYMLCKPGGIVLLESQGVRDRERTEPGFAKVAGQLAGAGFELVRKGTLCDDGINLREFRLLKRIAPVRRE